MLDQNLRDRVQQPASRQAYSGYGGGRRAPLATVQRRPARYGNDMFRRSVRPIASRSSQPAATAKERILCNQFIGSIVLAQSVIARLSPKTRWRTRMPAVLMVMACLLFGLGLLVDVQTLQANHSAKSQVTALSQKAGSNNDGSVPSETKPGDISDYQVAPGLPKYLKISKLGVNARIRPVGVTNANKVQAPSNIYDTGWYDASARPGDPVSNGAVVIDGHVHGPTRPGVFVDLGKLRPGDTIQIVRGDNQLFIYKVVKVQSYDASKLNMGLVLASAQAGKAGLNLITCSGRYSAASGQYTQRTVVFAVQT